MRVILAAILFAGPVAAHAGTHRFAAELATTPAEGRLIASAMNWTCAGPRCEAVGGLSDTPGRLCGALVKRAGRVRTFTVDGAPLADPALAKCNARAKDADELARD